MLQSDVFTCSLLDELTENRNIENRKKVELTSQKATPFVKWAGGKRSILRKIRDHLPEKFNDYYEPFVGGGAVFFDLSKKNSFISDLNSELITTYFVIKQNVKELVDLLKEYRENHNKEHFYKVRSNQFPVSKIEVAARFIYLNKTCYNGIYRVNKDNKFNTPFGSYKNPNILDEENLQLCSQYLQNVDIRYQSYDEITPKKGDLVYFDPPYHNTFLGYNPEIFDEEKQFELRKFCDKLTKQGVYVVLSNSDTDFIRRQYKNYTICEITAPRFVNCKINNRKGVRELLILNYDKGNYDKK